MYKYVLEKRVKTEDLHDMNKISETLNDITKYSSNMHEIHTLLAILFAIPDGEAHFRCNHNILFVQHMYPDSYQLKVQADIAINKEVVAKKGFDIVSETNIESIDIGNEIKFNIIVSPYKGREGESNHIRYFIRDAKERLDWLTNKLTHNGECSNLRLVETGNYVTLLDKHRGNEKQTTLYGREYSGSCNVEDKNKFFRLVQKGIGPCKNYGFGLLDVEGI